MRNIVVCADGTGNSFDTNISNVVRLVKSLVLDTAEEQIVFYDQGVGTKRTSAQAAHTFKNELARPGLTILDEPTMAWWPGRSVARVAGLGFGYGLKANIGEMYAALSREYKDADTTPVFLFGFSRGAFAVRALAGFIHRCGLLPPQHLDCFSKAFDSFYEEQHREAMAPRAREDFDNRIKQFKKDNNSRECRIHFLGLWDTVKSYGFIYPKSLPHLRHNPIVSTVRHALALNERRSYYQFTSWGGIDHPLYQDVQPGDSPDVKEVWFAGSHSDVGGGYAPCSNGLARPPFAWMVREARAQGLCVSDRALASVLDDFHEELTPHESLRRRWWITELLPRFELENVPFPGRRLLKWGSTGHRNPLEVARRKSVYVHVSVHRVYAQAELALIGDRIQTIDEDDCA